NPEIAHCLNGHGRSPFQSTAFRLTQSGAALFDKSSPFAKFKCDRDHPYQSKIEIEISKMGTPPTTASRARRAIAISEMALQETAEGKIDRFAPGSAKATCASIFCIISN